MNYLLCAFKPFSYKISYLTLLLFISFSSLVTAQEPKERFVCIPCDRDCDKLVFDKSGTCPHCNMVLIKQTRNPKEEKAAPVVIFLFDGVQIIDFTGPYEVLGGAGYEVVTVAANSSIKTNMGLSVNPNFTFASCPKASIFIIPGGDISGTRQSEHNFKYNERLPQRDLKHRR
jgi:hypothetical protein